MTGCCARPAVSLLLLITPCLGLAQEALPAAVLSYVDTSSPPYHVELIETASFEACREQGLDACEADGQTVAYRLPFQLESQAAAAQDDIDAAWQRFYDRVVTAVHLKINELLPCWNPLASCGTHINWACVLERQVEAVAEAFARYQPTYWTDVIQALVTHLPLSLWWEGVLPLQEGAVVAAITSLTPEAGQYTNLIEEPRDATYYFQPPLFPQLPVPHLPDELDVPTYPGVIEKEERKRNLELATVFEDEQFGFTTFWEAWGDFEDTVFMKWELPPRPSIVASICLISEPPYVAIIPFIPVPTFVPQVPKAFYAYATTPEGYGVPRLAGKPLFSLPDLDALLPAAPTRLPTQPQAARRPKPVPCLPEGASWPPDGIDSEDAGAAPRPCPAGTPALPMPGGR